MEQSLEGAGATVLFQVEDEVRSTKTQINQSIFLDCE